MEWECSTTANRPRRRVLAGEGMVTPVQPLEFEGKILNPRTTRLAPDHRAVKARPEKFTLCCRDDRTEAPVRFRAMLERAGRELEAEAKAPSHLPSTHRPRGNEPWRL